MLSIHWLYRRSHNSVIKTFGVDITYDVNLKYGGRQRIGTWLNNGDSYVIIKCWKSKGMQEKGSIMVVGCLVRIEKSIPRDHCLASLGKASWCQTVNLGWIFLSTSHTNERFLQSHSSHVSDTCHKYLHLHTQLSVWHINVLPIPGHTFTILYQEITHSKCKMRTD